MKFSMKIGIFSNEYQKKEIIEKIFNTLYSNQINIYVQRSFHDYLCSQNLETKVEDVIDDSSEFSLDMALSIGGDGTFLRTVALLRNKKIPILGLNTGRLGFLADVSCDDFELTLLDILNKKYHVEERAQIKLTVNEEEGEGEETYYALNEVAILKQDQASMITVTMYINGEFLSSYEADGLIVSTPTGSTAYSLSIGGAILAPNTPNFIITAIAPHSLTSRPLVVGDDNVLTMEVQSRSCCFLASIDGHSRILAAGNQTSLKIEKAEMPVYVIKRLGQTFYGTLKDKLKWGSDPRYHS